MSDVVVVSGEYVEVGCEEDAGVVELTELSELIRVVMDAKSVEDIASHCMFAASEM